MIKSRIARAGATLLSLSFLAIAGTIGNTSLISSSHSNCSSKRANSEAKVYTRVHSDAVKTDGYASSVKPQLLAQRFGPAVTSATSDYLNECSQEGIYHWPAERLPIKVYMEDGRHVPGYRANFPQILANGFDAWVTATNGKLGWVKVNNKSSADIVVSWTTSTPESEGGTEAGRTRTFTKFDTSTNEGLIYRATMALATRLPERELSDEEVTKTFMHEAGHAYGIAGHSLQRGDIMCAKVNRGQLPVLSGRDKATIVQLYGSYPQCAQSGPSNMPL